MSFLRHWSPTFLQETSFVEDNFSTDRVGDDGLEMILIRRKQPRSLHVQFTEGLVFLFLPSSSFLCLLHKRPMNLRDEVLRPGIYLRKLADREDSRIMSQNNYLIRSLNARSFYGSEMEGGEETR